MADNKNQNNGPKLNDQMLIRREKLEKIRALGVEPYGQKFDWDHHAQDVRDNAEQLEKEETHIRMAGRIMIRRGQGKTAFCVLRDQTGDMQLYFRKDELSEDEWALFKLVDLGDILGIEGVVFKTHTGELTVRVVHFTMLAKSLRPLPEKWHGLTDKEQRYRQRYLDLMVNPEVRDTFVKRAAMMRAIRQWYTEHGFLEVETPVLQPLYGGANAKPFTTHFNALDMTMYMRIAPELYLKRLLVGGYERIFEITRNFRNEGMDTRHNPEFTAIETYQAYGDIEDVINQTEQIVEACALAAYGTTKFVYEDTEIDVKAPWPRLTMAEAVKKYTPNHEDFDACETIEEARAIADRLHVEYTEFDGFGKILAECFDAYAEEHLIQPVHITRHPIEVSPLSKLDPTDDRYTIRFESYIYGRELANGFSELNDPIDQRQRFEMQVEERKHGDDEAHPIDEDFLTALEYGMPPTGGLGIGLDRLFMFMTNSSSIRDILLFPAMKPETALEKKVAKAAEEAAADIAEAEEAIDFSKVEIEPLFQDFVDFETFSKSDFRAVKVKECVAVPKSKKLLQFTLDDGTGTDRTILSGIHAFYEPEELVGKTLIAIVNLPPRKMMGIESCGMLLSAIHNEEGEEKLHLLMVDRHIPAGAKLY